MNDNASAHLANLEDEFLEGEDIYHMDWPARSPDMNPIEHAWVLAALLFVRNGNSS